MSGVRRGMHTAVSICSRRGAHAAVFVCDIEHQLHVHVCSDPFAVPFLAFVLCCSMR